jgi:CubicO group peptidase (beta-lactamase class C family)
MKILPALLSICSLTGMAQSDPAATAKKMKDFLAGQAKHFRFNGNVLVARNVKVFTQGSYGLADYATKRPLNDSSIFELASVSKQFTATGILLLRDKGRLKLTDTLRQYFPELPYHNVTLWHMLTHTSGLPDYEELMMKKWDRTKIAFNKDMIAFLTKESPPVVFVPGSKWEYSNTAYAILASVIEKVSGQSFKQFMAENIFTPLHMNHSSIYNTRRSLKDTLPNYAYGYIYNDSLKKYILPDDDPGNNYVIYLDGVQGDGIVNSTTGDLLNWDRAIKNHTLLRKETIDEMLSYQSLSDTVNKRYYGYGVFLEKNESGDIISHSGGWPGYNTYLARHVDNDETYVVLSNNNSSSSAIYRSLLNIMGGKPVVMPYEHKAFYLDSAALLKFVGTIKANNRQYTVERDGNKLFIKGGHNFKMGLTAESATKFFFDNGTDNQLEFELDQQKIKTVWVISMGVKTAVEKLL